MTSCSKHKNYFGAGTSIAFNNNSREYGIKCMWNPTQISLHIGKNTILYPYVFGQGNYNETNINSLIIQQTNTFNFRPGIGITGYFRKYKVLSIRTFLQLGYDIQNIKSRSNNPYTLDLKLGFGINNRQIKKNKSRKSRAISI